MRNYLYVLTIEPPEDLSTQDKDHFINSQLARLKDTGFPNYGKCLPNGLRSIVALENGSVRVVYESDNKFSLPEGFNDRLVKNSLARDNGVSRSGEAKGKKVASS